MIGQKGYGGIKNKMVVFTFGYLKKIFFSAPKVEGSGRRQEGQR
jgi:hypothetical protein